MTPTLGLLIVVALFLGASGSAEAQVFRFHAPPGGVYLNAAFEREATVEVEIAIEHEGAAVPDWFVTVSRGASAVYEPRSMASGASTMEYQIYGELPPSARVLKAPPETLAADNVLTSGAFSAPAATLQTGIVTFYVHIPAGQFEASGEYSDSVTLSLYTGNYATPGTHALVESVAVSIVGRMARLLDIYAVREPGIRTMDLTATVTDRLIATVNERSNSATGYTVAITSTNLAADLSGETAPFFQHGTAAQRLGYSLTYGGVSVVGWAGGSAVVTDSVGITAGEWLTRELRISYAGSESLAAGDYQDVLTVTISAK